MCTRRHEALARTRRANTAERMHSVFGTDEEDIAEITKEQRARYPYLYDGSAAQKSAGDDTKEVQTVCRALEIDLAHDWIMHSTRDTRQVERMIRERRRRRMRHGRGPTQRELLYRTGFFRTADADWIECGTQLCLQAHAALVQILDAKGITYKALDYNFNIFPVRTLTTKERKKSRLGALFNVLRELGKFCKIAVDLHIQHRAGRISTDTLMNGLCSLFADTGKYTGIYRHKYRLMKQITRCKDLLKIAETHGMYGCWQPLQREWLHALRGLKPLLGDWARNLVLRLHDGRTERPLPVTKQRAGTIEEVEIRQKILAEVEDTIPPEIRSGKLKQISAHMSEAWSSWKAGRDWARSEFPPAIEALVDKYVALRTRCWIRETETAMHAHGRLDKVSARKYMGRLTRLHVHEKIANSTAYLAAGPDIETETAVALYRSFAKMVETKGIEKAAFPATGPLEEELLGHVLVRIEETYSYNQRLTSVHREELSVVAKARENPYETLEKIRIMLGAQRIFRDIAVEISDVHGNPIPIYTVDPIEKLADMFLDQYLAHWAHVHKFFPGWQYPRDDMLPEDAIKRFAAQVSQKALPGKHVLISGKIAGLCDALDFSLWRKILRKIMDPRLAEYIIARQNVRVTYKDMEYTNVHGLIPGLGFAPFVCQLLGLCTDIEVLALCTDALYIRSLDEFCMFVPAGAVAHCSPSGFQKERVACLRCPCGATKGALSTNRKAETWIKKLLQGTCRSITDVLADTVSEEGAVHMRFAEYDVCIAAGTDDVEMWCAPSGVAKFERRICSILSSSSGATFFKTASRWNAAVLGLAAYYWEKLAKTPGLVEACKKNERKIQKAIMAGINTKMPARFPAVIFYSPPEVGGLGMVSFGREDAEAALPAIYSKQWRLPKKKKPATRDCGWRTRLAMRMYTTKHCSNMYYTDARRDGLLVSLTDYRKAVSKVLGGLDCILEHTILKSTGHSNWGSLRWRQTSDYEQALETKNLTQAQRTGISQLPNRRFVFWWSAAINRSIVYVGFRTQIDLCGVFMHGKLSSLKTSYVQIFREHLWQRIHESAVVDICQHLESRALQAGISRIEKQHVHPRKSYILEMYVADIVVAMQSGASFWIDCQLYWGNCDEKDPARYAAERFRVGQKEGLSLYPCADGVVVAIDLCFAAAGVAGSDCILRTLAEEAGHKIVAENTVWKILRTRILSALDLEPGDGAPHADRAENIDTLVRDGILLVDDTHVHRRITTARGSRALNGALVCADPATGIFYLCVVPKTFWKGKRRLKETAEHESGVRLAALLAELSGKTVEKIVLQRRGVLDTVRTQLSGRRIAVEVSTLDLALAAVFKIPYVAAAVNSAPSVDVIRVSMYAWPTLKTKAAAFGRLLLVLKAYRTSVVQTEQVFEQYEQGTIFPACSGAEWSMIDCALQRIVVHDYCAGAGVDVNSLTLSDCRKIIVGACSLPAAATAQRAATLKRTKTGNIVSAQTTTPYERTEFVHREIWQQGWLLAARSFQSPVCFDSFSADRMLLVSSEILREIPRLSAPYSTCFLLLGEKTLKTIEVTGIAAPPQRYIQECARIETTGVFGLRLSVVGIAKAFVHRSREPEVVGVDLDIVAAATVKIAFGEQNTIVSAECADGPLLVQKTHKHAFYVSPAVWNYNNTVLSVDKRAPICFRTGLPVHPLSDFSDHKTLNEFVEKIEEICRLSN